MVGPGNGSRETGRPFQTSERARRFLPAPPACRSLAAHPRPRIPRCQAAWAVGFLAAGGDPDVSRYSTKLVRGRRRMATASSKRGPRRRSAVRNPWFERPRWSLGRCRHTAGSMSPRLCINFETRRHRFKNHTAPHLGGPPYASRPKSASVAICQEFARREQRSLPLRENPYFSRPTPGGTIPVVRGAE